MATLEELMQWCEQARKLLSLTDKERSALADNSPVVKKLLELMKKTPADYPGLSDWTHRFEVHADAARKAREDVKAKRLKEAQGRDLVREASRQLLALRHELEMAIAEKDPRAAPEVRQRVLDTARHKPVYMDKRQRITEAIAELQALPGTVTQVTALQKLLDDATLVEPDYHAAYEALEGLSGTLAAGRKAAAEFAKGLGDPKFKTAMDDTQRLIDTFETKLGLGAPGQLQDFRQQRALVLMDISKAPQGQRSTAVTTGTGKLNTLAGTIQNALDEAERRRLDMVGLRSPIMRKLGELKTCAPADVVQPWLQRIGVADNLASMQQYAKAAEAFKALKDEFTRVHELHLQAQGRWTVVDQALTPLIEGVRPLLEGSLGLKYPALVGVAGPLNTAVVTEMRAGLVPQHRYVEAVAMEERLVVRTRLQQVIDALKALDEGKTPDLDFKDAGTNQRVALGELDRQVNEAVARANAVIGRLEKAAGEVTAFREQVSTQKSGWSQARQPFYQGEGGADATNETRDKALKQLKLDVTRVVEALDKITQAVEDLLGDSGQLTANQEQKKAADALAAYRLKAAEAARGLKYLHGFGLPAGHVLMTTAPTLDSLEAQYKHLDDEAAAGRADEALLGTLIQQIAAKRLSIENSMNQARASALQDAKTLGDDLGKLSKADKGDKAREAFHEKQTERLNDLLAMVQSSVPAVSEEGVRLLALFKTEVANFALEAGKKTGGVNYAAVDTAMKALKTEVTRKDFKTWLPTQQGPLEGEFNQLLPTKLTGQSPAEALALINELRTRVDEAIVKAEKLMAKQANLTKLLNEAKQALESNPVKTRQPKVYADLKARLKALENAPEYDIDMTIASVNATRQLIDAAAEPQRAQKMADRLDADAFQAEKDRLAYEAEADVFEKNDLRKITALKQNFSSDLNRFNTSLFDQIGAHHDAAKKDAKAGNYAGARERLRLARATAAELVKQPLAPQVASGESLVACAMNWENAVGQHLAALERVEKAMTAAWNGDGSVTDDAKKETLDLVRGAMALLNAAQFRAIVLNLSKGAKPELKEQALASLRQSERIVNENLVLDALRSNPFSPYNTAALSAALRDMKGALLAA
ncbi:hypothetical protein KAK06_07570 [Ideonella sp. 4Y11]|uniref:Uncharacterized protein n=1 Tax=Ideonella aquatica TaxID=2824119 RepID=A0A941BKP2_9BURK|nr:hypothetical protein [Ideonella aquatica]MBQ0958814.1 hypothetical protein [Ideonella aquatica]